MLVYGSEVYAARPLVKSLTIGTKAKIACQGTEEGIVPVLIVSIVALSYLGSTHVKALTQQRGHETMQRKATQLGYDAIAGRIVLCLMELSIVVYNVLGDLQLQLRDRCTISA